MPRQTLMPLLKELFKDMDLPHALELALGAERLRGHTEGCIEMQARAVLTVLSVRRIAVSAAERARILAETDLVSLLRWHDRAIVAASIAGVFDDDLD